MGFYRILLLFIVSSFSCFGQKQKYTFSGMIADGPKRNVPLLLIEDSDTIEKVHTDSKGWFTFKPIACSKEHNYFVVIDLPEHNTPKQWKTIFHMGETNHANYNMKLHLFETSIKIHDTLIRYEPNEKRPIQDFDPIYLKIIMDKEPGWDLYMRQQFGADENEAMAKRREKNMISQLSKAGLDMERIHFSYIQNPPYDNPRNILPSFLATFSIL